jgi:hypothetical protein
VGRPADPLVRPHAEHTALALGHAFEQVRGHRRPPPAPA